MFLSSIGLKTRLVDLAMLLIKTDFNAFHFNRGFHATLKAFQLKDHSVEVIFPNDYNIKEQYDLWPPK